MAERPSLDWVRENLAADDGTILSCPDCHLVTVLGFCGHGFDLFELMSIGEEQTPCIEVTPGEGDILLVESPDYPGRFRAYFEPAGETDE